MDAGILLIAGAELWVFKTELSAFSRAEDELECVALGSLELRDPPASASECSALTALL